MSTTTVTSHDAGTPEDGDWAIAAKFLDALTGRDFEALHACLDADVRFRALVPPGPFELSGADDTVGRFRFWFGECEAIEVLDAAIGQVGTRMYLRWRIERRHGDSGAVDLIEQHVFVTAGERVESLDLLCSGIHAHSRQ